MVFSFALRFMARGDVPSVDYTHPHQHVELNAGGRINLFCSGSGSPTVVFIAGGGEDSSTFRRVQGPLSLLTRVCSYDRPGLGFSDPAPASGTAIAIVLGLNRLIDGAGISRPVVLVGHSIGGLYAELYAARHPADVAGMVLIDPSFVGQDAMVSRHFTAAQRKKWIHDAVNDVIQARECVARARSGALASAISDEDCLDDPPDPDPILHGLWETQLARTSTQQAMLDELLDTHSRSASGLSGAERALQSARFEFGRKPLVVLTAGEQFLDLPISQRREAMAGWIQGHEALARKSAIGRNILIPGSSHFIQLDRPDVVVQAVTDVVMAVRLGK
jgi:pimeloyl-ACP methyl ester carboxylesterase